MKDEVGWLCIYVGELTYLLLIESQFDGYKAYNFSVLFFFTSFRL